MSGSDPSVGRGGITGGAGAPGGGGAQDGCPGPEFTTTLSSPDPGVVADLDVGDLLDVVSVESPVRGVVARTLDGEVVGALTRDILHLRNCMAEGWTYEAEVLRLAGGSVSVAIREAAQWT